MTAWISWGFDAARLGAISCTLTETGGGGATGAISMTGQYMHHVAVGTYTSEDPITGESETLDTGYTNFGDALEGALNAVGNATYSVVFDPAGPGYTISAYGGSVTAFALTSISTAMQRVLGINESSLSGAASYDCTEHADGATRPLWHWTVADIGWSEWAESERDLDGEDLIGSDGSVRGIVSLGTPTQLDFVVPWEAQAKIWNASVTSDDWTWQRALARCRTIEPVWVSGDPRVGGSTAVVCMLRSDGCTLRPRMASSDYLGHQSVPIGAWRLGSTEIYESDYYAYGWADSLRYYQSAAGAGRWSVGTVRLVGMLLGVPDGTQRIIACNEGSSLYGWRIVTGLASGAISVLVGGSGGYVETARYTFAAGDVGKLFVIHLTVDTVARLYMGGAEVGAASSAVTITDPGVNGRLTLGQYRTGGFANGYIGIVCLSVASDALSASEVATDAESIMSRTVGLVYPELPGEDQRHVAADIATASAWADRLGSLTLTETGDVYVQRIT